MEAFFVSLFDKLPRLTDYSLNVARIKSKHFFLEVFSIFSLPPKKKLESEQRIDKNRIQ